MRISDWSSDVCSSDLLGDMPERISRRHPGGELHQLSLDHRRGWAGEPIAPLGLALHAETGGRDRVDAAGEREERAGGALLQFQLDLADRGGSLAGDRKSVVSGKGVSVRVELGGRRII